MTQRNCDVTVVGAGAVGLVAALGFARLGFRVRLVGPAVVARDARTAALLTGSVALLRKLGVWQAAAAEAAPLRVMRLVDDTDSLFRPPPVAFRADEIGLEEFGWNIENSRLAEILGDAVRQSAAISWSESVATGLEKGEAARLRLADGEVVEAVLIVAADGRMSRMREAAGIGVRKEALPQRAITTILAHSRGHEHTSTEFHTRAGPFTLVPLPGDRSSLVWVTQPRHAERLSRLDDAELADAVDRQAHGILGRLRIGGPRGSVPLSAQSALRLTGHRLALVGEAAHVLPPIGAQGLNLGFADVEALLRLSAADPGSEASLQRYERERRGDIRLRSTAVQGLNRALLNDFFPVDALRGLGLGALAKIGPLRRFVMRAMLPSAVDERV